MVKVALDGAFSPSILLFSHADLVSLKLYCCSNSETVVLAASKNSTTAKAQLFIAV